MIHLANNNTHHSTSPQALKPNGRQRRLHHQKPSDDRLGQQWRDGGAVRGIFQQYARRQDGVPTPAPQVGAQQLLEILDKCITVANAAWLHKLVGVSLSSPIHNNRLADINISKAYTGTFMSTKGDPRLQRLQPNMASLQCRQGHEEPEPVNGGGGRNKTFLQPLYNLWYEGFLIPERRQVTQATCPYTPQSSFGTYR